MFRTLHFLSANVPFTKHFELSQGELSKSNYPNVKLVTSHVEQISSPKELHDAIKKHAAKGHCLLKGTLHKELRNESRAGATRSDDKTSWICLDLDGSPFKTPKAFLTAHKDLSDVSAIVQYSASYGLAGNTTLRCHIFMLLDGAIPASLIKVWLQSLNLTVKENKEALTLSRTAACLHYSLDITSCQNDRLLYIAPPVLGKGITSILTPAERIQFIPGKLDCLPVKRLLIGKSSEQLKKEARDLLNAMRKAQGYTFLRGEPKIIDGYEIQTKPGVAEITGIKEDGDFVRLNLNGGDSWAYYHPVDNFERIFNFKGEPVYPTKELLPDYYKDKKQEAAAKQGQPTEDGLVILAFRDKRTASYWNGTWNPTTQYLELHPANSRDQLADWMLNHGLPPYDVIPIWDMHFDPTSNVIVDNKNKRINTFVPTKWLRAKHKATPLEAAPLIKRIILHAVSGGEENEVTEHFLNWLAVIFQKRIKTITAWVLHGTEGTGKGLLVNSIIAPLLGREYVEPKLASELEEKFTGWMEKAIIVFIDEIKVSASQRKDIISANMRSFITENPVPIRHMNRIALKTWNYSNFILSSNEPDPIQIKDNDRRYNIGTFQKEKLVITKKEIYEQIPKELEAFMNYIMTRKADEQIASTRIDNQAHHDIVRTNRTSLETLTMQLQNGDIMELWDSRPDIKLVTEIHGVNSSYAHAYIGLLKREIKQLYAEGHKTKPSVTRVLNRFIEKTDNITTLETKLTRDELLVIFEYCVGNMPRTPNKFTALLRHRGLNTERMRHNGELTYGTRLEWRAEQTWLKERITEFEAQETKLRRVK